MPNAPEQTSPPNNVPRPILVILAVVGIGLCWYGFGYDSRNGIGSAPQPIQQAVSKPEDRPLSAAVRIIGSNFVIQNADSFGWSNCSLAINEGLVSGEYETSRGIILSRSTVTIPAREFARSSGERFDLLTLKANKFSIKCDTPSGRAYYFGGG